jgi:hypothetical protein
MMLCRRALIGSLVVIAIVMLSTSPVSVRADDRSLMETLYNKMLAIAVPGPSPTTALPPQVLLLEGGGISIRREDFDDALWAAGQYRNSMPKALTAQLVDRVPRYIGTSFVDSGTRVSQLWNNLLHSYVVPVIDNPVVNRRVAEAKAMLANGTLDAAVFSAIDQLQATYDEINSNRDDCLKLKDPDTCARNAVLWMEKRSRNWYNLEIAKRQVEGVDATLIALQTQDLKGLFASALQSFSTYQKIDIGASTFGNVFYDTTLTPSNWWTWFPLDSSAYSQMVRSPNNLVVNLNPYVSTLPPTQVVQQPQHGSLVLNNMYAVNNITYTPTPGYTGPDSFSYIDNNSPQVRTVTIGVMGTDITNSNPAFTTVSVSSTEVPQAKTSVFNRLQVSETGDFDNGAIRMAGGLDTTSTSATASLTTSTTTITFEMAKVLINRPWLDTSLLAYYPVALAGLAKNSWSDGTVFPNRKESTLQQIFKILPTGMIVARNIRITSASLTTSYGPAISSSSSAPKGRLQVGPFSIGSDTSAQASVSGSTVTIQGPQIIAWVATPMPAFPTATDEEVHAYEKARSIPATPPLNYLNATNVTNATTTATPTPTPTVSVTPTPTPTPTVTPAVTTNGTNGTNSTK